jgi:HEAT repeat protein
MFLYGSVKGDDTSDQVMRLAAMAPLDVPDMLESVADALAFVPNPGVEDPLRLWLQHAEAERRIVAARALSRRGSLTMEEGLALTRDRDSSVLVAGADAAVSIRERDRAGLISPLLQHKEEGVVRAAIRASILRGENGGYTRAVELLSEGRGDFADACIFVALSGGAEHGPALFEHATHTKSPASIAALGWFGHLGAVEFLLDRLADEDEAACSAAVVALERILGASLTEITTDPEYPPEALPFERPFVDWEVEMDIFGEPVVWRAWWEKHRGRAKSGARYRYGSEWTIAHVMWEIEQPDAMLDTRRLAHMELVTRLGAEAPFDPEAFVAKQRRQLAAWHVVVQSRGSRIDDASWPGAR